MTLPTGIVTFLFTDIEGSTRLWETDPAAMRVALARHDSLLRERIESHQGIVFKTVGDAFCAVFAAAGDAVTAALAIQEALCGAEWDSSLALRVRIALHSGEADQRSGDYFGPTVNRVARLLSIGHGGQILLSAATSRLAADDLPESTTLREMGAHRLKDLQQPENVSQLCHPALPDDFPSLKSLDRLRHNLPVQVTNFVGREKDIETIKALLAKTRLLTLTGAGGMGKTRLSLQVVADLIDANEDGVWFVELAPVSDPALVIKAVASVLDVREEAGRPLIHTLTDTLKFKKLLLVLDNCEHVLTAAATVAESLLKTCPHIRILASSREGLGVAGEQIYRIPSLSLPAPSVNSTDQAEMLSSEAVRLFTDRARLVNVNFALSAGNAPALRRLCHQLDGIPLALELAAARVRSMPVEQIESRLDDRFRLLTGGSRTALPRQQTLRALIDWSYDLLNDREKALLQRLSLFSGGWTIEAAEAVCADDDLEDWEILDILLALVDKSLVLYEQQDDKGRYRLLETVRQYALERLKASGAVEAFQARHRDYFLDVAEAMNRKLLTAEQAEGFRVLAAEIDNLRAAIAFTLVDPGGIQPGLRLGTAMARFWWTRDYLTEGRESLTALVSREGAGAPTRPRAFALASLVALCWLQGDVEMVPVRLGESLAISRASGDRLGVAIALGYLGNHDTEQGDYEKARADLEESLATLRELGNLYLISLPLTFLGAVEHMLGNWETARALLTESLVTSRSLNARWWSARALLGLSLLAVDERDYAAARAFLDESLALCLDLRDTRSQSSVLGHLGLVLALTGDFEAADRALRDCLGLCRNLGNRPDTVVGVEAFAHLACLRGQTERAARLCGAADTLRSKIARPRMPMDQTRYDDMRASLRDTLGDVAFTAALIQGAALNYDEAIDFALEGPAAIAS